MKNLNTMAVGLSLLIGAFAASPCLAGEKAILKTTELGDGITMSEFADRSGFEMNGGGAQLTYDTRSKTMTMIDPNGVKNSVCFDANEVAASTVQAVISQR